MGEDNIMDSKRNLLDIKSIMWLLEKFLRNATDEERIFFGLETNRIFLNLQSEPDKIKKKVRLV